MRTILFVFCLVFWSLVAKLVLADDWINKKLVVVDQLHVVNPFMPSKDSRRMLRQIMADLRNHSRIKIRFSRQRLIDDFLSQKRLDPSNTFDAFYNEFIFWWNREKKGLKKGRVLLVTAPPWTIGNHYDSQGWPTGGSRFSAGWAWVASVLTGGFCYHTGIMFGSTGKSTFHQSKISGKHELLHTLGATHNSTDFNTMHPSCQLQLIIHKVDNLPVLQSTIEEVRSTLRKLYRAR